MVKPLNRPKFINEMRNPYSNDQTSIGASVIASAFREAIQLLTGEE